MNILQRIFKNFRAKVGYALLGVLLAAGAAIIGTLLIGKLDSKIDGCLISIDRSEKHISNNTDAVHQARLARNSGMEIMAILVSSGEFEGKELVFRKALSQFEEAMSFFNFILPNSVYLYKWDGSDHYSIANISNVIEEFERKFDKSLQELMQYNQNSSDHIANLKLSIADAKVLRMKVLNCEVLLVVLGLLAGVLGVILSKD